MKITATQYNERYSVETDTDDLDLEEVRDTLLAPLLLAMGFSPHSVEDLFFDKSEQDVPEPSVADSPEEGD